MRFRQAVAVLAVAAVISGCGGGSDEVDAGAPPEQPSSAADSGAAAQPTKDASAIDVDVPWQNYAADVRTRVEALYAKKECAGLQGEFDIADQNNTPQRNRTGKGNTDLMKWLDTAMKKAGCY